MLVARRFNFLVSEIKKRMKYELALLLLNPTLIIHWTEVPMSGIFFMYQCGLLFSMQCNIIVEMIEVTAG